MGIGSTISSRSLGSKGGTSLPPSYENRSPQQMNSGLGAIFNQYPPQQYQPQPFMGPPPDQLPNILDRIGANPTARLGTEANFQSGANFQSDTPLQFANPILDPTAKIGHFEMDEYGRGFGQGFGGPPPDQGGQPARFDMGPPSYSYRSSNPYSMPFENRYIQQFRPTPAPFVPVFARDYATSFPDPRLTSRSNPRIGKGGKGGSSQPTIGEQTYFNRPVTSASGGVVKSAAGRYLQGPGDGTSDSIPAMIGNTQPARLADGEFVIDARTVSEIGNGSSNAGAKKLYAMMERVHRERKKAKRGQNTNADRFLPV